MNLIKDLGALDSDSLSLAIGRMTSEELMGLVRPIAQTPKKWRGETVCKMYDLIRHELQGRSPARWIDKEQELERMETRAKRIEPFLAPFRK